MSNRPNTRAAAAAHQPPKPEVVDDEEIFDADALLAEIRAKGRPFKLGGQQFFLPEPTTWSDEAMQTNDPVVIASTILGDDYDRFVEAGGTSLFLQEIVRRFFGASLGESSGSSTS